MDILNYIWKVIKGLAVYIVAALIGVIAGLIWKSVGVGFITFFGCGILYILFIFGRQLYWKITKTGDYRKNEEN